MAKKRTTLRDVATKAGVSTATVSLLLNNKPLAVPVSEATRTRVFAAARELGYRPNRLARGLATNRTNVIGLSWPVYWSADNPYPRWEPIYSAHLAGVLYGIQSITFPRRYEILLLQRPEYEGLGETENGLRFEHPTDLLDGLIYVWPNPRFDYYTEVTEAGMPLVFVGPEPPGGAYCSVGVDNENEVFQLVSGLIARGHRRIGFILPMERDAPLSQARLRGYERALAVAGLPLDPRCVVEGTFVSQAGQNMARQLLTLDGPPTALILGRNDIGMDVMAEIRDRGVRCPEDIEVISVGDDHGFEWVTPKLSALQLDNVLIATEAVRLLFDLMDEKAAPPKRIVVPCQFKQRESTRE